MSKQDITLEEELDKEFPYIALNHFEASGNEGEDLTNIQSGLIDFIQKRIDKAKKQERDRILDKIPCKKSTAHTISSENAVEYDFWDSGYDYHVETIKKFIDSERTK